MIMRYAIPSATRRKRPTTRGRPNYHHTPKTLPLPAADWHGYGSAFSNHEKEGHPLQSLPIFANLIPSEFAEFTANRLHTAVDEHRETFSAGAGFFRQAEGKK
jgi:hypothetical protein